MNRVTAVVVVVASLASTFVLASCASDGRTLKPAHPTQTLSITPSTDVPAVSDSQQQASEPPAVPGALSLSGSWENGTALPADSTCKGKGLSPDLNWSNVPADATELVLTVTDAAPDGFVNWILAGIDPATPGLAQGRVPRGTVQALNSKPTMGWTAPCPPEGTHRYIFSLFALTKPSGILAGMSPTEAIAGLTATNSPHATLTATVAA